MIKAPFEPEVEYRRVQSTRTKTRVRYTHYGEIRRPGVESRAYSAKSRCYHLRRKQFLLPGFCLLLSCYASYTVGTYLVSGLFANTRRHARFTMVLVYD